MTSKEIQEELIKIQQSSFARETDKQLLSYEILSELHKNQNKGIQPTGFIRYNKSVNRRCKLTIQKVKEIRTKYNPHVYGKQKLAREYGVATSVVHRILKGKSWKLFEDSS